MKPRHPARRTVVRDSLQATDCARYLKALADPERLRIIECLQSGPLSVGDLSARVHKDVVNVSHHLRVLRQANLVQNERRGKFIIYSLNPTLFASARQKRDCGCLDLGCCRLEWNSD